MSQWLSLCTPLGSLESASSDPGCGPTCCSLSHAVVASHIEELEGLTTRIHNYVLGLWGGENKKKKQEEDWQQV